MPLFVGNKHWKYLEVSDEASGWQEQKNYLHYASNFSLYLSLFQILKYEKKIQKKKKIPGYKGGLGENRSM